MARNVILDVDTGSDDACAIMLAALSPEINLLGVVAVNGNRPLADTLTNSLKIVELLKMQDKIPVVKGAAEPLVRDLLPGRNKNPKTPEIQYDENGVEVCYHPKEFNLPAPTLKPVDENFVSWYIKTIKNSPEKVTLVPVGPLTNIAILLRAEPSVVDNIEEIVIMGGGHMERNSTAAAEFNIWKDPEAAEIVMNCGAKITLVPLDATHAASTRLSEVQQYKDLHTPVGDMIAELIEIRTRAYNILQPLHEPDLCPIHDALCIAYLIDPNVLKDVIFTRVDVDISGGFADGMTIVDTRHFHNRPDNCYVALNADRDLFNKILYDRIALFK
ncbi:MAG: nucleoside hydrolase [Clostridia bacterium]|nr:nucleoside hydrolase [Clostridia bacterium]